VRDAAQLIVAEGGYRSAIEEAHIIAGTASRPLKVRTAGRRGTVSPRRI
jgi:hypothetical protein